VSSFSKTALDGNFEESVNNEIHLPEQEPAIFNYFAEWVYCRKVDLPLFNGTKQNDRHVWETIGNLYVLADYLQSPAFGKYVLDSSLKKEEGAPGCTLPNVRVVTEIFARTASGYGLQKLFAAVFVWRCDGKISASDKFDNWLRQFPPDCVREIAKSALARIYVEQPGPFGGSSHELQIFHDAQ
jgi:hypothetical protein